jgi:hypothetical protein
LKLYYHKKIDANPIAGKNPPFGGVCSSIDVTKITMPVNVLLRISDLIPRLKDSPQSLRCENSDRVDSIKAEFDQGAVEVGPTLDAAQGFVDKSIAEKHPLQEERQREAKAEILAQRGSIFPLNSPWA